MAISQNFPDVRPSLNLNFARSKTLDPRITFERASIGTYVDENGLIKTAAADEARFDHNPETGESLGLLIEEQRTNLFTYSEDFSDISWTKAEASISNVSVINPSGGSTSTKITESANGPSQHGIYYNRSGNAGTYTLSVFLKAAERTIAFLQLSNFQTAAANINVNLTDGSVYIYGTNADYTYINAYTIPYGNGWYRCILTATKATTTTYNIPLIATHNGTIATYTGDGVSGIYVWGAQLEQEFFPTSYIPTSGSEFTREPDNARITGTNFTDFYNATEGTLYTDFIPVPLTKLSCVASIASNNINAFGIYSYNTYQLRNIVNNDSNVLLDAGTVLGEDTNKIAGTMKLNDFAASLNGGAVGTDTDGVLQSTPNTTFYIGTFGGVNQYTGRIKQLRYYPERLTNAQLQNLTK